MVSNQSEDDEVSLRGFKILDEMSSEICPQNKALSPPAVYQLWDQREQKENDCLSFVKLN